MSLSFVDAPLRCVLASHAWHVHIDEDGAVDEVCRLCGTVYRP